MDNLTLRRRMWAIGAAVLLGGTIALAGGTAGAQMAPGGSLEITNQACVLTITATVEGAGDYAVQIWDDGEQIAQLPFTATAGQVVNLTYTVTAQPGEQAEGIGILLVDAETGEQYDEVDPYLVDACAATTTTSTVETTSTTGGSTVPSSTTTSTPAKADNIPPAAKPATTAKPKAASAAKPVAGKAAYTG